MMQSSLLFDPQPQPLPAYANGKLDCDLMRRFARTYVEILTPVCSRIAIGGSLRRLKPTVKDIEIIAIEKYPGAVYDQLCRYQSDQQLINFWIKKGPKYMQFVDLLQSPPTSVGGLRGSASSLIPHPSSLLAVPVDVFLSPENHWGWTFFIRTGSDEWNMACMQRLNQLGYKIENNQVYRVEGSSLIPHPSSLLTEQDIFDLLQIPFVEPHLRHDKTSLTKALRLCGKQS